MSTAYRWVEPPWPLTDLPREQLEDRIQQLLGSTNMCVMATVNAKGQPIASPIEFYADGLDLYMLPDPGTPKLKALHDRSIESLARLARKYELDVVQWCRCVRASWNEPLFSGLLAGKV